MACVLFAVLLVTPAFAQQPRPSLVPRVGYVYPAGGRVGETFVVTIGGRGLDDVNAVRISGSGVQAVVLEHVKPITPQQANALREKLKDLLEKKFPGGKGGATRPTWTPEDEKQLAEIRKKLMAFQRRPMNPALAETLTLRVSMTATAEPGTRELRLASPSAVSNPVVFCVGQLPEFREINFGGAVPGETKITIPSTVNGQIMPGEVDRIRFKAAKGQRIVIAASARELLPYLADAVPGWFQATLGLYDDKGKEVAYDDDYKFHPDPVLFYQLPRDGEYVVEIKDAIYRGREDFVYRITIGEIPFITSIFPLGGKAGGETAVEIKGWNLPTAALMQESREKPGIYPVYVKKDGIASNSVSFAVDTLPECVEKEPNNTSATAQSVTLPIIINGRIDRPGDWDVYRIEGAAGQQIVAEVMARRLDSPLDSVLRLTDANGRQIALNDDHENKADGLNTHHADSYILATLPANGTYFVHIGDTQRQGGVDYAYRLRISAPRPDYELRVAPSSITLRGGTTASLTVYALRKDGFAGEIALSLKDAPSGFALAGAKIPAGQDQVRLTLTAPLVSVKDPFNLRIQGRAVVQGREVIRPAVPAEDMMQAFAYHHLVPAREMLVHVSGPVAPRQMVRIITPLPLKLPASGAAFVDLGIPTDTFLGKIHLELSDPPEGVSIRSVTSSGGTTRVTFQCESGKTKPGQTGNLIVAAFLERQAPAAKAPAANRRIPLGMMPAIPYEITPRG